MTEIDRIFEKDIKGFLKKELNNRRKRNPSYSLRAFAKFLEVSDSYLSQVLRGKHYLSQPMLMKIGKRLQLDSGSLEKFKKSLLLRRRLRREKTKF